MILIIGGSGTFGKELLALLLSSRKRVRLFSPALLERSLFDPRVELYEGDANCEHCLREAMQGVHRIFFVATGTEIAPEEQKIAQAAKSSGVLNMVKFVLLNGEAAHSFIESLRADDLL